MDAIIIYKTVLLFFINEAQVILVEMVLYKQFPQNYYLLFINILFMQKLQCYGAIIMIT